MGHRVLPRSGIHPEMPKYCHCIDDEQNKQNEWREKMETRSALRKREGTENRLYPNLTDPEENGEFCEKCFLKKKPVFKGSYPTQQGVVFEGRSKARLDSEQQDSKNVVWPVLLMVTVLVIISIIWLEPMQWIFPGEIAATLSSSAMKRPTMDSFNRNLKAIKDADNSVNKEIWPAIISSARMVLKRDPSRTPAVIAMIALKDAFEEASQIALKFSETLASIYNDNSIVEIHGAHEHDVAEIHRKINTNLVTQSAHAVIIYDFDKMSNDTAMSFHGFFDDENAPFKEAFFTLVIRSELVENGEIDLDNVDATSSLAGTVKRDKLASLESRIRTKVFIRKP